MDLFAVAVGVFRAVIWNVDFRCFRMMTFELWVAAWEAHVSLLLMKSMRHLASLMNHIADPSDHDYHEDVTITSVQVWLLLRQVEFDIV